jgi:hypothetical protein
MTTADAMALVRPAVATAGGTWADLGAGGGTFTRALAALLGAGIEKLGSLGRTPLSAPVPIAEQPPVPIDVLLYRGRSAIERCLEIRDQVRTAGGPVDADTLGELFDLLDLALTD